MKLEPDQWYLGYSQILKDCRPDDDGVTGSALILSNVDVDAMCAARILSYMLRSDGISYHLLPCMSFTQLNKTLSSEKTDDVRAVVLLNMGASRNLTKLFENELLLDPSVKIYVMDFRRPVHLANIHAGENIVVFWDSIHDIPSDGDNLSGYGSSSSEDDDSSEGEQEFQDDDDDDDDEGEHEFLDDEDQKSNQGNEDDDGPRSDADDEQEPDYDGDREDDVESSPRSKKRKTDGEDDSLDGEDDDNDDEGLSQQQEPTQPTLTPRERHEQRRDRLRTYYSSGTFHGSPAAYVAYRVSTQLRFGEVGDLLWLACVGVTDAYLHARLDVSGYAELAMNLRQNCTRLFPNDMYHRVENASYAEHLTGAGNRLDTQGLTKIGFSENGRILSESDFRFFLLRHSSLYDAIFYSDFVSTRLQLITPVGKQKLQELLAKMGYPLEECRQPFAFMKPSLRRRLQEQMRLHAEDYGLDNFEFTSFFRVTGYQSLLSAADTSYAVTALLECDNPKVTTALSSNDDNDDEEESRLLQSFNFAYDALNSNEAPTVNLHGLTGEGNSLVSLVNGGSLSGNNGLGAGIRLAMVVQKSIISTTASLIERDAITKLPHFRYAYLTCTSDNPGAAGNDVVSGGQKNAAEEEQQHIFAQPLALTRLAQYLIDLNRVNGEWAGKPVPLVLLAQKPRTKTYLVVAYEYAEEAGHFARNKFGKNFELAAQSMEGTFRFESFDSNVVEVNASDVQRFIEQLHYILEGISKSTGP